jgi:hypothetical protein
MKLHGKHLVLFSAIALWISHRSIIADDSPEAPFRSNAATAAITYPKIENPSRRKLRNVSINRTQQTRKSDSSDLEGVMTGHVFHGEITERFLSFFSFFVFDKYVSAEPVLLSFWDAKEDSDKVYVFDYDYKGEGPLEIIGGVTDPIKGIGQEFELIIDDFSENSNLFVYNVKVPFLPPGQYTLDISKKDSAQSVSGDFFGKTTVFEIVEKNNENIFELAGRSAGKYYSSPVFRKRQFFERLNNLNYLWWNQ